MENLWEASAKSRQKNLYLQQSLSIFKACIQEKKMAGQKEKICENVSFTDRRTAYVFMAVEARSFPRV